ncbi:MAG: tetratricopeptide repeat protein [Bacteriovoracia bacterium]
MAKKYKIKLASGRIVGPLDLDRIALLIKRDQILGTEEAREHPRGEWKDINQYTDLADLIIAKLEGKSKSTLIRGDATKTAVDPGGVTVKLDETGKPLPGMEAVTSGQAISELSDVSLDSGFLTEQEKAILDERKAKDLPEDEDLQADAKAELKPAHVKLVDDDDASKGEGDLDDDGEKTVLASNPSFKLATQGKMDFEDPTQHGLTSSAQLSTHAPMRDVTNEETVIFQGRGRAPSLNDLVPRKSSKLKRGAIIAIFIALALEVLIPEKEEEITWRVPPFKPALPAFSSESVDAAQSELLFKASLKYYVQDTVSGYKNAAKNLLRAASLDNNNVKAMALLASCYLNLIDSSNKDDKYFQVISSVIERSRAKSIDLQETVIADVEFYLTVGRGAAAQKRIVDFTSTHTTYGVEMFYYLAYVFYKRGNYRDAAKFVAQIPEEKIQIPRIYYLRGQIAEKLGTLEEARQQYLKALKVYRNHAKSRLTLADIYRRQSELLKAESHLNFLKTNPHLLSPEDLARSYYLSSLVNDLKKNVQQALGDIEVAVKLDPNNHDYMLELFTLRYRAGD